MVFNKKQLQCFSLIICAVLFSIFFINIYNPRAYAEEVFSDVFQENYFYDSVTEMKKLGVVEGYPGGEFKPYNNITVAEVLSVIFRNANINYTDDTNVDSHWYTDVMDRAISLGIVSTSTNPNEYVNRLDVGRYIVRAYNLDTSKTVARKVFVDTNSIIANTMFEYGIFVGAPSDEGAIYMPKNNITRADICMVLYRLREKLSTPLSGTFEINGVIVNSNPTNFSDFKGIISSLDINNKYTVTIPYSIDLTDNTIYTYLRESCIKAFEYNFSVYPEKYSFTPKINLKRQIVSNDKCTLKITLGNEYFSDTELYELVSSFNTETNDVISELTLVGKLNENQNILEKVKVLFEYVVLNTKYDVNEIPSAYSYIGYGASNTKLAVCQGYVAFFNNLCKNIGVECEGVTGVIKRTGVEHMWSKLYIDGAWHYFDVTYADPIPDVEGYCDFTYFNMSYDLIMADRNLSEIHK